MLSLWSSPETLKYLWDYFLLWNHLVAKITSYYASEAVILPLVDSKHPIHSKQKKQNTFLLWKVKEWYVTCIRIECSALIPCNDTSSLQIPVTADSRGGGPAALNNWVSAGLHWKSLSWLSKPSQPTGAAAEAGIFYSGSDFNKQKGSLNADFSKFIKENSAVLHLKRQ